jgi:hypothetical protein
MVFDLQIDWLDDSTGPGLVEPGPFLELDPGLAGDVDSAPLRGRLFASNG